MKKWYIVHLTDIGIWIVGSLGPIFICRLFGVVFLGIVPFTTLLPSIIYKWKNLPHIDTSTRHGSFYVEVTKVVMIPAEIAMLIYSAFTFNS